MRTPLVVMFILIWVLNSVGCTRGCNFSDTTRKEELHENKVSAAENAVSPANSGTGSANITSNKINLIGKWNLTAKDDNPNFEDYERVWVEFSETTINIIYYDNCKHVCPYTISGDMLKFSYPAGESETVCQVHAQPEGNKQEAVFNLIDKDKLSVFLDNIKFSFEREKLTNPQQK